MNKVNGIRLLIIVSSVVLFISCAPGYSDVPSYEEPAVEQPVDEPQMPEAVQLVPILSKDVSMDLNAQMLDQFVQAEPMVMEKLDVAVADQDYTSGFGSGDLRVNWDQSQMAYKQDLNQDLIVDVVAAPVQSDYLNPEKLETMMAAGDMPQEVAVGAVAVLSDYPDLSRGEYVLVWNPAEDEVCIRNPDTGECSQPEYCLDNPTTFEPYVEMSEGSVEICVSFDSRRCCVTFGR